MRLVLPENFIKTISSAYGKRGENWLAEIPKILKKCEDLWEIKVELSNFELSYNYITAARRKDGSEVILKIGYPQEKELITEMKALAYFKGRNIVHLIEKEIELGAMLLRMIRPGTTLREIQKEDDEKATRIAAPILRDLPIPIPKHHSLPAIADWALILEKVRKTKSTEPITEEMLTKAQLYFAQLEKTKTEQMLLHGDLHHDNILFDEQKGWKAIDPKGVIGDPAFHGARFIQNFWNTSPNDALVQSRVDIISSVCGYDQRRVAKWAYVDYIISNLWTIEENRIPVIAADYIDALESIIQ